MAQAKLTTFKEAATHPMVFFPTLGALAIIIPALFWLHGYFAKESEVLMLECRISVVVNENAQNIGMMQSETEIKKINRDIGLITIVPLVDRSQEQKDKLDELLSDKEFYKKLLEEIRVILETLAKRQVRDPCRNVK